MSEKDVRETLRVLYEEFYVKEVGFDDHTASAVYGVLEPDPDIVAVAKELRRAMNWAKKVESVGLDESDSAVRIVGQVAVLEDKRLLDWLQDTFGFRLTEDGWEWIETEKQDGDTTRSSQDNPEGRTERDSHGL